MALLTRQTTRRGADAREKRSNRDFTRINILPGLISDRDARRALAAVEDWVGECVSQLWLHAAIDLRFACAGTHPDA